MQKIQQKKQFLRTNTSRGHTFNKEEKFTIIEQIKNNNKGPTETRTIILKRENFWIQRLRTLTPSGLNQELN